MSNGTRWHPRRFLCNFEDGTAEFNPNDTPPAEEYLSLAEHEALMAEKDAEIQKLKEIVYRIDNSNWKIAINARRAALEEALARVIENGGDTDSVKVLRELAAKERT